MTKRGHRVEWFFDVQGNPVEELTNIAANSITQVAAAAVVIIFSLSDLYREINRFRRMRRTGL